MAHKTEKQMINRNPTPSNKRSNVAKSTKANAGNTKRISYLGTDKRLEKKKKVIILTWKFLVCFSYKSN
jgi:hypothetical protein